MKKALLTSLTLVIAVFVLTAGASHEPTVEAVNPVATPEKTRMKKFQKRKNKSHNPTPETEAPTAASSS